MVGLSEFRLKIELIVLFLAPRGAKNGSKLPFKVTPLYFCGILTARLDILVAQNYIQIL